MVAPHSAKQSTPERDASLGLIFRLNNLWAQVDVPASNGDYIKWNSILDRIYCNLLYRNELDIVKDKDTGEILSISLGADDKKEYDHLSKKIFLWRSRKAKAGNKKNKKGVPLKLITNSYWYHAVQLKDIWLRKLMMVLGLYLKEIEKRPGSSFFGNVG